MQNNTSDTTSIRNAVAKRLVNTWLPESLQDLFDSKNNPLREFLDTHLRPNQKIIRQVIIKEEECRN